MVVANLIKKDLVVQKKYILFALLYMVIFSFIFNSLGDFSFVVCAIACNYLLSNTALALDEKYKADLMLNIMPTTRTDVVVAKHVTSIIVFIFSSIIYILLSTASNYMQLGNYIIPLLSVKTWLIALLTVSIFILANYPFFYKFGYQKSRYFSLFLFFVIFGFASTIMPLIDSMYNRIVGLFVNSGELVNNIFLFLTSIIILGISIVISIRTYKKQDF